MLHPSRLRSYALDLSRAHGLKYAVAFELLNRISIEADDAMRRLVAEYGAESWQKLPFKAKAAISTTIVKNLLNKKMLRGLLNNEVRSIV